MSQPSWSVRLYQRIVKRQDDETSSRTASNFLKLIFSQFLTNIGDALVNPKVTLPWLMNSVGSPTFLIGWLVPIRESGSLLPQLYIANVIKRLSIRKWVWVSGSLIQAACLLGMAAIAALFEGAIAGVLILVLLTLFSFARGLNSVANKDVLGKSIPKAQRGQVTGLSASAAGLVTVGIGVLMAASYVLDWNQSGYFVWGLVLGSAMWFIASVVFAKVEEDKGETEKSDLSVMAVLGQLSLLKTDKEFRRFVITRAMFLGTALSAPYYVLLAEQQVGGSIWVLALFMVISGLAGLLSGPFWGRFSDVSSRKVLVLASALGGFTGILLYVLGVLFPEVLSTVWFLPLFYFLLTVFHQGIRVGRKTYLVDMADGNKRTSYTAVGNTAIGIILLTLSLLGVLSEVLSLETLIGIYSAITLLGVLFALKLPDVSHA